MALIAIAFLIFLAAGYKLYGRYVASQYRLDDQVTTPAVTVNDGIDYCPTKPFYLLGQHFSAIAAAGPIVGPIAACLQFGWLPCLLWIGLGAVFIGAVHDFSCLVASVRHEARSIAEIVRQHLGRRGWIFMMLFIWLALIYVICAFTDVTAGTFVGLNEDLPNGQSFNTGGAVAFASTAYLLLAIIMGVLQRKWNPPLWLMTIIFVPATLGVVYLGYSKFSTLLTLPAPTWAIIILVYCFAASLLPVWLLLQPRGYLGGFVLYMALAAGIIGIFFGHFEIQQNAFTTAHAPGLTGSLFPFLFVTIACGACSGFHGLVASGTTSKQIASEPHCRPVGYGGMLLEGFVALIALATVMIAVPATLEGLTPGKIYGNGIGHFLAVVIGEKNFALAATFGMMAFSTFIFDTLDVATRLGRYILQELFNLRGRNGAIFATLLTIVPPAVLLLLAGSGKYLLFWTLFGSSNQLLAALSLLAITVWLKQSKRPFLFTLIPMLFVMVITVWSLILQASWAFRNKFAMNAQFFNGIVSVVLIILAMMLAIEAIRSTLKRYREPAPTM
ncbi:carbon starvation protein A [bacterium]|nr:carbon starvation protein A [bacterium]